MIKWFIFFKLVELELRILFSAFTVFNYKVSTKQAKEHTKKNKLKDKINT